MPPLTIALGNYGLTKALKERLVAPEHAALDFVGVEQIVPLMRRMVRQLEFDICEMAFTTYLCAKAAGKPITAIPVFVTRNFHHWAAFGNVATGIASLKGLEGRVVGVNRGYTVTTGLWVRGILASEYGLDLRKVTWAPTDDEHVEEYRAPANVTYKYRGQPIAELLRSGEVAAAIGDIRSDALEIRPLIADARQAGFAWYRKIGIYPINHTVVVKDAVLAANPGIGADLVRAFDAAKRQYLDDLDTGTAASPADETARQLQAVVGRDPYPFGIAANRPALETIIRFAVEQKVIPSPTPPEALFARDTLDFA
jgi:4,5-dihydroxyphthalate decarboxylase